VQVGWDIVLQLNRGGEDIDINNLLVPDGF